MVLPSAIPSVGLESKYAQEGEVALLVSVKVLKESVVCAVAEREGVVGDILAVVVVDGCSADSFILLYQKSIDGC